MKIPDQFAAKLLEALRPREREVLGLHYLDQFAVPDVATLLEMKPGSVSGHLSKGIATVASIVSGTPDQARDLLDAIGEVHARRNPKNTIHVSHRGDAVALGVLPHRQLMGGAVREDHGPSDISAFFVVEVDGHPVSVGQAREWYLRSPTALGLGLRRHVLALKGIKPPAIFEKEANAYFFPVGFGCAELYYEKNFKHEPLLVSPTSEKTIVEHMPPMPPLERGLRSQHIPETWPLRVMDLGEYAPCYDDDLADDAEEGLRQRF